jgi:hypothetical protein
MNTHFKSGQQETLFNAVLSSLQQLGYRGELLKTDYAFVDLVSARQPGARRSGCSIRPNSAIL